MSKSILTISTLGEFNAAATEAYKFYVDNIGLGLTGSEPPVTIEVKNEIRIVLYRELTQKLMEKISSQLKQNSSIANVSFSVVQTENDNEQFEW